MIPNPRLSDHTPGSKAYKQAVLFNKAYTKLLKLLEHACNGHPETMEDATGLMYGVELHLKALLRAPVAARACRCARLSLRAPVAARACLVFNFS